MKTFLLLILFAVLHTLPLWNLDENLAGGYGDPFAHAAISEWFCQNVVPHSFDSKIYMAPFGVNFSGNYDSPFPFILTCPFESGGSLFQFHLFALFQILLIVISSWWVARRYLKGELLQAGYVLFVWWCGFYITRSHQHLTLLSVIWGLQFVILAFSILNFTDWRSVAKASVLLGLAFAGTFQNIATLLPISLVLTCLHLVEHRKIIFTRNGLLNVALGLFLTSALVGIFWGPMIGFTLNAGTPKVASERQLYNLDLFSAFLPADSNMIYQWLDLKPLPMGLERFNSFDLFMVGLLIFSMLKKSFWQNRFRVFLFCIALGYFVLALGPELRFQNEVLAGFDINEWLYNVFPLSVTRTPARMATVTSLCIVLLGFLACNELENRKWQKAVGVALLVWIFATGPLMNNMIFFPFIKFQQALPMKGLESLRKLPSETTVVSIPAAWAQDPSQNFNRLFHRKNITAAYLAYPLYTEAMKQQFLSDPFLANMGCEGDRTPFRPTVLMTTPSLLQQQLRERNLRGFVINKTLLVGNPNCEPLLKWLAGFLKYPWVRVTEENRFFVTAEIL